MIGLGEVGKTFSNFEIKPKDAGLKERADSIFKGYNGKENIDISKPVFTKDTVSAAGIKKLIPETEDKQKIEPVKPFREWELQDPKTSAVEKNADSKNIQTVESKETENQQHGLSEEEKKQLKEETGWSDEIIDAIGSKEEAEIYKKAGLKEAEINGKKCLIRDDIDMNQKDELGRTNKERMENRLSPVTKTGETVELHHIGQKSDSPLAELTTQEHRGKGNDTILHDKHKKSEIDREAFKTEREQHWESRANTTNEQGA